MLVIDFMPQRDGKSNVVRIVVGKRGRVPMHMQLILRFDYGSIVPWVSRLDDGTLRAIAGPDMVVIRSHVELHGEDLTTVAEFTIDEGEERIVRDDVGSVAPRSAGAASIPTKRSRSPSSSGRDWAAQCKYAASGATR